MRTVNRKPILAICLLFVGMTAPWVSWAQSSEIEDLTTVESAVYDPSNDAANDANGSQQRSYLLSADVRAAISDKSFEKNGRAELVVTVSSGHDTKGTDLTNTTFVVQYRPELASNRQPIVLRNRFGDVTQSIETAETIEILRAGVTGWAIDFISNAAQSTPGNNEPYGQGLEDEFMSDHLELTITKTDTKTDTKTEKPKTETAKPVKPSGPTAPAPVAATPQHGKKSDAPKESANESPNESPKESHSDLRTGPPSESPIAEFIRNSRMGDDASKAALPERMSRVPMKAGGRYWSTNCEDFIDNDGAYGEWGTTIVNTIDPQKTPFLFENGAAKDMQRICPRFNEFDTDTKKNFWVWFIAGMAMTEKSCADDHHITKGMRDKQTGRQKYAAGLLQFEYRGNWNNYPYILEVCGKFNVFDSKQTVTCGIKLMDYYVGLNHKVFSANMMYFDELYPTTKASTAHQKFIRLLADFGPCGKAVAPSTKNKRPPRARIVSQNETHKKS